MIELPEVVIYKIYVYGGANIFYLNKNALKYIQKLRLEFLKKPIKMYYTISEYEKRLTFSNYFLNVHNWRVNIIKRKKNNIKIFKLWRGRIGKYVLKNKNTEFILYESFKKKIIDERILVNKDYFKDKSGSLDTNIILGKRYDIEDIWCYDNRLFKYIELWG